jgi:Domain of unknown function (DUF3854)/Family of unknown function (DUF5906)
LKSQTEAKQAMLAKLKTSLLTARHAAALRLQPYGEAHDLDIQPSWSGFKIPYFTLDGKVDPEFYRFRYTQDRPSRGFASLAAAEKPRRYAQPANSGCNVYLPPLLDMTWREIAKDSDVSVVITEGELKAACGCAQGIPTLGLGGVYSWRSTKEGVAFLPILEAFNWLKRKVYLCFDSDLVSNAMVRMAEGQLARALAARGAETLWTILPPGDNETKQGMDDFMYASGLQAFQELLAASEPLGPGIAMHQLNSEVAMIHSTAEVLELQTGNIYSVAAFADAVYRNRTYVDMSTGKSLIKCAAKEWLAWPLRNRVARIEYEPSCNELILPDGAYNAWATAGWGCVPSVKGTMAPWHDLLGRVFTSQPADVVAWVRRWFAYPLQHPGAKLHTALLIWGQQTGTGKTLLGDTMRYIYGRNYGTVNNTQLASQFNEWLENKQFIVGDEIALGDKRHLGDWLKDIITGNIIRLNSKNRKTYAVRNCVNFYFTSNHDDAMYIEAADRRIFVNEVTGPPLLRTEYERYLRWLQQEGGAERLFHYLLHEVDLADFDPVARPPATAAKYDMAAMGRGDLEDWAVQLRNAPDSVLTSNNWDLFRVEDLLKAYDPEGKDKAKSVGMGRALNRAGVYRVAGGNNTVLVEGVRARFYAVRNAQLYQRMGPAQAKRAYEEERRTKPGATRNGVGAHQKFMQ